jgi:hypothetical protein
MEKSSRKITEDGISQSSILHSSFFLFHCFSTGKGASSNHPRERMKKEEVKRKNHIAG